MILNFPCASVSASPNSIFRPKGSSNVCFNVICIGPTTLSVIYRIVGSTVTFDDGSQTAGPFQEPCRISICRTLNFIAAQGEAMFPLTIEVSEVGVPGTFNCTINIQVN